MALKTPWSAIDACEYSEQQGRQDERRGTAIEAMIPINVVVDAVGKVLAGFGGVVDEKFVSDEAIFARHEVVRSWVDLVLYAWDRWGRVRGEMDLGGNLLPVPPPHEEKKWSDLVSEVHDNLLSECALDAYGLDLVRDRLLLALNAYTKQGSELRLARDLQVSSRESGLVITQSAD